MDHSLAPPSPGVTTSLGAAKHCQLLAETLLHRTGADAVGLTGICPDSGEHVPMLNLEYEAETFAEHTSRRYTRLTPGVQQILDCAGVIHSWDDIPGFRDTFQAQAVYEPAGFHNGISVALSTERGDRVGILHVSTRRERMDSETVNLVESARPALSGWTATWVRFELARLSAREVEILDLVRSGQSNTEIATELVISLRTVTTHVERILRKLGARNRTEAAVWAERYGLTPTRTPSGCWPRRPEPRQTRAVSLMG